VNPYRTNERSGTRERLATLASIILGHVGGTGVITIAVILLVSIALGTCDSWIGALGLLFYGYGGARGAQLKRLAT